MITNDELLAVPDSVNNLFDSYDDISWLKVFCVHFKVMPNSKCLTKVCVPKVIKWLERAHADKISKRHVQQDCDNKHKQTEDRVAFVLNTGCLVYLNNSRSYVEIFYSSNDDAQELIDNIRQFRQREPTKNMIHLVIQGRAGLNLHPLQMKLAKCSVKKNYNDDMQVVHQKILKYLKKKDLSGLTLFHGLPGTGKSTYIRYLLSQIKKEVIFLSPRAASNMDDPQLTSLLIENPNSVVVIEDAEDLLTSRDSNQNSGISTLLNISDGLLGAGLGIQFICTFNTALINIDSALLRKGRLRTLYEFKPLAKTKSRALLLDLGVEDYVPEQAMTLAEIYNLQQQTYDYGIKTNQIGFVSQVA
jgi:hypothetical protein